MSQRTKGVLCIACSAFCFASMNTFVRLSGDLPTIQKSFFRNFVALLFALVMLLRSGEKLRCSPKNLPLLLVRSAAGTFGILGNFYAVDHMLLSDASLLNKLSPFFTILFSRIFLRERLTLFQGAAVCTAFAGALLIIKPGMDFAAVFPALMGFLGGMGAGGAYTAVRALTQRGERGPFIVFFFSGFSCLVALPSLILDYHPMSPYQLAMLLLAGLSAAGGQFTITAAYSFAPAREISVFDYTNVLFAALWGFLLFSQVPDGWSILGYGIITAVAVAMFFYNKRQDSAGGPI